MKNIIKADQTDSALELWRGADAKIWMFHASHSRFALMLYRFDEPEVLYIVANGCEHIVGPFSWKKAQILIEVQPFQEPHHGRARIIDAIAGFELHCSSATLVSGPATELDTSFDGFFNSDDESMRKDKHE